MNKYKYSETQNTININFQHYSTHRELEQITICIFKHVYKYVIIDLVQQLIEIQ